jgi:hypothetical protein
MTTGATRTWKGAILVSGEPGTGKTHWIRQEAAATKARLFQWNARIDRSLREGREILHQQVRSKEYMFVWIEGADDLTQEAQAFLRRILETAAANVTCVLEVRELWKLSPPILSRCTIVNMKSDVSYRQTENRSVAAGLGIPFQDPPLTSIPAWRDIPHLRQQGHDPYAVLDKILEVYGAENKGVQDCIRAIGAGCSPWIQISNFLMQVPPPQPPRI